MLTNNLISLFCKSAIVIFLFGLNTLHGQWINQESGVDVDLYDVCFVDSLYGWAVGDSSTLISTTDGGVNWIKQTSPIDNVTFRKVEFNSRSVGFVTGRDSVILSTINGGENWMQIELPTGYNYSDFSFVTAQKGWISGLFETPTERFGIIYHTEDGGITWTEQLELNSTQVGHGGVFVGSIECFNDSLGWALVGGYMDNFDNLDVYFTENGGENWDKIGETNHLFSEIISIDKDILWGYGLSIEKSQDNGMNWTRVEYPMVESTVSAISLISEDSVWAIFYYYMTKESELWLTTDGGNTWEAKYLFGDSRGLALTHYQHEYLWIVGQNGLIMSGKNILTKVKNKSVIDNEYNLYQNYPNPFNPRTLIFFNLPRGSNIKLKVYNSLGKEIRTLITDYYNSGHYSIIFDGSNLSSGVYYYSLTAKDIVITKKMLLLK